MEIERKFLVDITKFDYTQYPSKKFIQGYLNTNPVVRVRKEDDDYFLTYKGKGLMVREEYNLPLNKESFDHLINKADGNIISKTRYFIPYNEYTIELDVFDEPIKPLILAEVEFPSVEAVESFVAPAWFKEDVTNDTKYHNSNMSKSDYVNRG